MSTRKIIMNDRLRDNERRKPKVPVQKRPVAPRKGKDLNELDLEDVWDSFSMEQPYQQEHTERYARQQAEAREKSKLRAARGDEENTPAGVDRMVKEGLLDADAAAAMRKHIALQNNAAHFERMRACLARL